MNRSKYLSGVGLYFAAVAVSLALFFELWRAALLLLLSDKAAHVPAGVLAQAFLVGWRFDFAVASDIVLPLLLLGALPFVDIARRRPVRQFNFGLLLVLAAVTFFVQLADIEFFNYYNARLNGMALLWNDTPGFVLSMIWDMYPIIRYLLLYIVVLGLFVFLVRWLLRKLVLQRPIAPVWVNVIWLVLVFGFLFVGSRGRLEEKAPLRWGLAYFSEYDFANQLALNPNYTFFYDLAFNAGTDQQIQKVMDKIYVADAELLSRRMLGASEDSTAVDLDRIVRPVRFDPPNDNPPNVIVIIMESFGSTRIGVLDNRWPYRLTPSFDSAADRGILFTNFYSNGMHTYTGIFSTLYGYPHLLGKVVMKQVVGHYHVWGLPSILKQHGYETVFYTTHDPHFDNMQGFLKANGVDRIFSENDYDDTLRLSSMGVADHVMFDLVRRDLRERTGRSYMATILTGSNHGPWLVPPESPVVPFDDSVYMGKQLTSFMYSDWALGRFLNQIAEDSAFANTLIVVTSDNGAFFQARLDLDLTEFQIPLLIYNTDWQWTEGKRSARLGSQNDILSTVMGQVRLDYDDYSFGHDLLDSSGRGPDFVLLSEWYRIGYIEDGYYHISRIDGPQSLFRLGDFRHDVCPEHPDRCADYDRKALALYQTAYYNLMRPLRDSGRAGR